MARLRSGDARIIDARRAAPARRPATNGRWPAPTVVRPSRMAGAAGTFCGVSGEYTPRTAALPDSPAPTCPSSFPSAYPPATPRSPRASPAATPPALTPLYQRHRGRGLPLRAALVGVGRGRRRRHAGRLRAPADPRRRLRRRPRPAAALAPRHRAQLRAPAHRGRRPYVANDDDAEPRAATELPRPTSALDAQQDLDRLRAAIAALPPHYRDVLVLVELAERSYAEAAAICGCELNTVRSRLFARARPRRPLRSTPRPTAPSTA